MKWWTLSFVFSFSFALCERYDATIFSREDLVIPLMDITAYMIGKQKEVDDRGNIIGENACEINFSKAHLLFQAIEKSLRGYPKLTNYPIAQTLLKEMHEMLSALKQDIESLPDGPDKNQFRNEWSQLTQYISSLMVEKGGSKPSTIHPSPAG